MSYWRAGCTKRCKSGSEGGGWRPAYGPACWSRDDTKTGKALAAYPTSATEGRMDKFTPHPDIEFDETQTEKHFFLTKFGPSSVYLLLCNGAPVTVRSQQVRAVNLAWALREELQAGMGVAVIGVGAAGASFAAAAAKLGAKVHLFEASELMHLQVGCRHRPLHPEIYT